MSFGISGNLDQSSKRTDSHIEDEEWGLLEQRNRSSQKKQRVHYASPCQIPPLNQPSDESEQLVRNALGHICKHISGETVDCKTQNSHIHEAANDLARAIGLSETGGDDV